MKTTSKYFNNITRLITLCLLSIATWSCDAMKTDDLVFVRVDLPKFYASYQIEIINYDTKEPFTKPVALGFAVEKDGGVSDHSAFLVTNTGKKIPSLNITDGFGAANLNPNIVLDGTKEISFFVHATTSDPNYVIAPNYVKQSIEGTRIISMQAIKVDNKAIRSAIQTPVGTLDNATFASNYRETLGNGYAFYDLYKPSGAQPESTVITPTSDYLAGLLPFNATTFPSPLPTSCKNSGLHYVVGKQSASVPAQPLMIQLPAGGSNPSLPSSIIVAITVVNSDGIEFNQKVALRFNQQNNQYEGVLEGLYTNPTSGSATIKIESLTKGINIGTGSQNITLRSALDSSSSNSDAITLTNPITVSSDYYTYQAEFVGYCSSSVNGIAYYVTTLFQYSEGLKFDPIEDRKWESSSLEKGKGSSLLKKNTNYTFRVNVNNSWVMYDVNTDPAKVEEVLKNNPNVLKGFSIAEYEKDKFKVKLEYKTNELCQ